MAVLYGKLIKEDFSINEGANFWAKIQFHNGGGMTRNHLYVATSYLFAPGQGVLLLSQVENRIIKFAREVNNEVLYLVEPTDARAKLFFQKQSGYKYFDRDRETSQTFYAKQIEP